MTSQQIFFNVNTFGQLFEIFLKNLHNIDSRPVVTIFASSSVIYLKGELFMRKIIVISMMSLDGVIQAPGDPEEDRSGEFEFGGWTSPYTDAISSEVSKDQMKPADLLLGRYTFEIWENYWPEHAKHWPGINEVTKYVLSTNREETDWDNCVFLKSIEEIKKLKSQESSEPFGSDIKVWGSSELVQQLLEHDLVDELRLNIYPLTLGKGKKLFGNTAMPTAFTLMKTTVTTTGIIVANYQRAEAVKTSQIGE